MFPLKTTILRSKALKEKQELPGGQWAHRPEEGLWGTTQGVCFVRKRQTDGWMSGQIGRWVPRSVLTDLVFVHRACLTCLDAKGVVIHSFPSFDNSVLPKIW